MKSKMILGVVAGICAGLTISKYRKEIKKGANIMVGKIIEVGEEISEKREKSINKRIDRLEDDRLDAIEESDFNKADEINFIINNMKKEKLKKGVKLGLGITAAGIVVIGYKYFEYYIL